MTSRYSSIFSLSRTLRGPKAATSFSVRDVSYQLSKTESVVKFQKKTTDGSFEKTVSISTPEANVHFKPEFFEFPYFVSLDHPLLVYPHSTMKTYLTVPIKLDLVLKSIATGFNKLDSEHEVEKYCVTNEVILDQQVNHTKKRAWQGSFTQGMFCTLVKSMTYNIDGVLPKCDLQALVPLYIASHHPAPVEVSNIIIDTDNLGAHLWRDYLFTNIVHVNLISATEAKAYVTAKTVKREYQKMFEPRQGGGRRLLRDFLVSIEEEKGIEYEF